MRQNLPCPRPDVLQWVLLLSPVHWGGGRICACSCRRPLPVALYALLLPFMRARCKYGFACAHTHIHTCGCAQVPSRAFMRAWLAEVAGRMGAQAPPQHAAAAAGLATVEAARKSGGLRAAVAAASSVPVADESKGGASEPLGTAAGGPAIKGFGQAPVQQQQARSAAVPAAGAPATPAHACAATSTTSRAATDAWQPPERPGSGWPEEEQQQLQPPLSGSVLSCFGWALARLQLRPKQSWCVHTFTRQQGRTILAGPNLVCMLAWVGVRACMCTQMCACARAIAHARGLTDGRLVRALRVTHMHAHMHAHRHTHTPTQVCTHVCTCTRAPTPIQLVRVQESSRQSTQAVAPLLYACAHRCTLYHGALLGQLQELGPQELVMVTGALTQWGTPVSARGMGGGQHHGHTESTRASRCGHGCVHSHSSGDRQLLSILGCAFLLGSPCAACCMLHAVLHAARTVQESAKLRPA